VKKFAEKTAKHLPAGAGGVAVFSALLLFFLCATKICLGSLSGERVSDILDTSFFYLQQNMFLGSFFEKTHLVLPTA